MRRALLTLLVVALSCVACADAERDLVYDQVIVTGGARIEVGITNDKRLATRAQVLEALTTAAHTVTQFYGRFPVRKLHVAVVSRDGWDGITGTTYGAADGHSFIRITLGTQLTPAALRNNWVMTHEFVHLALPDVGQRHHWLEEGIATYVEPVARVQAGELPAATIWRDMMSGMPNGRPAADDRGLDATPTWGRTYWGGALFCLLADVEIRRRTNHRYGLRDALIGIVNASGNIESDWPLSRVLATADAAVGVPVLSELYAAHATQAVDVDLPALWARLGIATANLANSEGMVHFDDGAPDATIRRAITSTARY